jgi:hypothetical protein
VNGGVSAITVAPGAKVIVTVSNGPGFRRDWIATYDVGAGSRDYHSDWVYLNGLKTPPAIVIRSATLSFTAPSNAGKYNYRLFEDDGFTLRATSPTVTVSAIAPTPTPLPGTGPTLRVNGGTSPITVAPGTLVSVSVSGGGAFSHDWVGRFVTTGKNSEYQDWFYLNGAKTAPGVGIASGTVTFAMPTDAGAYEFRFFQNDGFDALAVSSTVTVSTTGP